MGDTPFDAAFQQYPVHTEDKKVIGLCGQPRVGKDTVGRILLEQLPKAYPGVLVATYSFALPIYNMLRVLCDGRLPTKDEDSPLFGRSLRYMLQTLGTDWGRVMVDEDIWVRKAGMWYNALPDNTIAVFTDVRFVNEAEFVTRLGGRVYRVSRRGVDYSTRHSSDDGLPVHYIHRRIKNNGSLGDLAATVWDTVVS